MLVCFCVSKTFPFPKCFEGVLEIVKHISLTEFVNLMTEEGFLATLMEVDTCGSLAQVLTLEDGIPDARGSVLGGSSVINAGFYSRAD